MRPKRPHEALVSNTIWTLLEHCWAEDPSERPDTRHVGLALDLIYGIGEEVDASAVSVILKGDLDDVHPQPLRLESPQVQPPLLPYGCKWLQCFQGFDNIDDCIAHECDEYNRRRTVVDR